MGGSGAGSLHSCIALLAIAAGSLLLAVHFYSSPRAAPLIPSTALGVLLLILSALLAYAGIRRSLRNASLLVSLCLTLSAFWCGYGVILVLAGQGALRGPGDSRDALVPGLAAVTPALLRWKTQQGRGCSALPDPVVPRRGSGGPRERSSGFEEELGATGVWLPGSHGDEEVPALPSSCTKREL